MTHHRRQIGERGTCRCGGPMLRGVCAFRNSAWGQWWELRECLRDLGREILLAIWTSPPFKLYIRLVRRGQE